MKKSDPYDLHVELTPDLIAEAQRRWDLICSEGCTKNGVLDTIDISVKPDWYDEERFKRGQAAIRHHYAASINATMVGLLVFLQLPVGLAPLLATGRSRNLAQLFKRYFDTLQYVDEWYHSDPFDPKSKSFKTLSMVHSMRKYANKTMNEKISVYDFAKKILKEQNPDFNEQDIEKFIRSKDRVWISQFDMIVIQWSFLGCSVLEPKASGLHGISRKEIEDILYAWKVLSYKIGIDPKYSLVEEINFEMMYAMSKLILEQEYILHLENVSSPAGIRMSEAVFVAFKEILVGSNCNVFLKYWYKVLNINSYKLNRVTYEHNTMELFETSKKNQLTEEEKQTMLKNGFNDKYVVSDHNVPFEEFKLSGFKERMLYRAYLILINQVLKYEWGKWLAKSIIRNAIFKVRAVRKEKMKELEQIENERYNFPQCPFTNGGIKSKEYPDIYANES